MTADDRISRYLADRAEAIALTRSDVEEVARRGRRRRLRRRTALVGCVGAVGLLAGSVALRDVRDTPVESGVAATVAPSNLDWTVVDPQSGLGYDRSTANVGGAIYSLSSAPGPYVEGQAHDSRIYRSSDGSEWVEVSGPTGVSTSSLAAQGDTLYAVGTAPAGGGGRDLVVATSRDGADSWSLVTLPGDVAALEEAHPGRIRISQPSVASIDGTNVVAAVVVSATPDFSMIEDAEGELSWEYTDSGIDVYDVSQAKADPGPGAPESGATTSTVVRAAGDPGDLEGTYEELGVSVRGELIRSYTWAQVGIPDELVPYLEGRTYVYASDDGRSFEPVVLPTQGWGASVVAADGYRLFVSAPDGPAGSTTVLGSEDGRTWTAGEVLPGSITAAGRLGDRPAAATYADDGIDVYVEQSGGSWLALDLDAALDGGSLWDVAFGPLGVVGFGGSDGEGASTVVHSDGSTVSAVALGDVIDMDRRSVVGVEVTADAFVVRLGQATDTDPATPPAQTVLVGTPR